MSTRVWFRRKTYGYGWTPSTWEGWVVLALYAVAEVLLFHFFDIRSHSNSDTVRPFSISTFLVTSLLIFVCYKKGETPGWRWGEK